MIHPLTRPAWANNFFGLLKIALPTIGLGACVGLIGEALNGTVLLARWSGARDFTWGAWGFGLGLVMLATLCCAYWLYRKLPGELPLRSLSRPARPDPHRALILLLSTPSPQCRIEADEVAGRPAIEFLDREGHQTHRFVITGDITSDKNALGQLLRWNWQQQLHALALHQPRLERIYLIGSSGPGGSHAHLESFARLARCYCDGVAVIWSDGIDFEDIEAIYRRALKHIVEAEKTIGREGRYRQDEIMIDATGGFKTASIAAGLVTLHNRVKFQYVNNSGQVVAYQMVYEPPRSTT